MFRKNNFAIGELFIGPLNITGMQHAIYFSCIQTFMDYPKY